LFGLYVDALCMLVLFAKNATEKESVHVKQPSAKRIKFNNDNSCIQGGNFVHYWHETQHHFYYFSLQMDHVGQN
jgi:hypothetical protein